MKYSPILILLVTVGCHPLSCNWNSGYVAIRKEPKKEILVGTYAVAKSSLGFFNETGWHTSETKLKLSVNRNYKFIDADGSTIKEGRWGVYCHESPVCVIDLDGVCLASLAEKDGIPAILITIGDGDECNGVVYEKS